MKLFRAIFALQLALGLAMLAGPGARHAQAAKKAAPAAKEDAASGDDKADSSEALGGEGKVYTRCNIWHEKTKISSVNYKTGVIIPAGTEIKGLRAIQRGKIHKVQEIEFQLAKDGSSFTIEVEPKNNPGLSMHDVMERFFSHKTFEELTKGMSDMEISCIKSGVLKEGMSKEAVLVAYGCPPKHRTPSTDANIWLYWTNRVKEKPVNFDDKGKTSRGQVIDSGTL